MNLEARLRARAAELGFARLGICPAAPSPRLDAYLNWIEAGMHGEMAWMARPDRVERRRDPRVILPGAQSILIVSFGYFDVPAPPEASDPRRGRFSNYAWNQDYHRLGEGLLEELAALIRDGSPGPVSSRIYVDTGPILERSHAEAAGLGFTGKNTLLIDPRRGSYLFLGAILSTAALQPERPAPQPGCGSCTRCLHACPTDAFPRPYVLDARRCISYLTIEHKGSLPFDLRPLMGNWVYGCDICQEVCPWNRFSEATRWPEWFAARHGRQAPPLADLLRISPAELEEAPAWQGSPVQRIGRDRLVRNACVAAGNSADPSLLPLLEPLLSDASPLLRSHAAWAALRLGMEPDTLAARFDLEADESVRAEIAVCLEGL